MSTTLLTVLPETALGSGPAHTLRAGGQDCYLNPNGTIAAGSSGSTGAPAIAGTYKALLTQTSTGAPSATVLENSIGTIVWARTSAGLYTATLTGAFVVDKTTVFINGILSYGTNLANTASAVKTSANVITLTTAVGSYTGGTNVLTDALLTKAEISITVYA